MVPSERPKRVPHNLQKRCHMLENCSHIFQFQGLESRRTNYCAIQIRHEGTPIQYTLLIVPPTLNSQHMFLRMEGATTRSLVLEGCVPTSKQPAVVS